ncbi:TrkH family potassium uptake protein [Marinicauda algicola]|uniref:TrkH family potassium uptake protein n=1 Tax=Marinicauda algicola TaxID=2029849 RepID=A0A4S2H0S8_9PROT|nr:potassium transporter TrkG [Marinicauda algicola]TGY89130.1 TrkH family potassium uptake protein [Marinicauda algicola]
MAKGARILSYAVRLQVVGHLTGLLCWTLTPLPALPLLVALFNGETGFAARLATGLVLLAVAGFAGMRLSLSRPRLNEVMVVSAMAFALPPFFMAWTFGAFGIGYVGALFESVSGLTTTGLSVLGPPEDLPPSVLFTRAWMQWFGGLGFVVLALGLMGGAGRSAARRLGEAEEVAKDPLGSLRDRARRTLIVYSALTLACFVALWASGSGAWHALLLCLTALSTGGFAFDSGSAAALQGWVPRTILIGFSTLGAVSAGIYLHLLRRKPLGTLMRTDLLGLAAFCAAAILGLGFLMWLDGGYAGREILAHAPFMALSAQTTTGYSTMGTASLPASALVFLMIAMAIGGNSGSTAGGVKTFRVLVAFAVMRLTLQRPSLPQTAATTLKVGGHEIDSAELQAIATVIGLAGATFLFAWLPFLAAGYGLDSLFDVVSATTTTGLSTGVAGPALEPHLKLVLSLAMLLGRVEFIALLVLLWPPTWLGQKFRS